MLRIRFLPILAPLAALSAVTSLAQAQVQAKRAMTLDDLLTAVRVGDPQVSPDGKRVLFTRTTTAMPAGTRNADIWVVAADGSTPSRAFIERVQRATIRRDSCRTARWRSSRRATG